MLSHFEVVAHIDRQSISAPQFGQVNMKNWYSNMLSKVEIVVHTWLWCQIKLGIKELLAVMVIKIDNIEAQK